MARLPTPGGDDGAWGGILNDFLDQSHNANGSLKPSAVSSAGAEQTANKGQPNGYAGLDGNTQVPLALLPATALSSDSDVSITAPSNNQGLIYNSVAGKWTNQTLPSAPVTSVAGKTGVVTLVEGDIANLTSDLGTKAVDTAVVHNTGAETVAGVKTFTSSPVVPTPGTGTAAANKAYVDSTVSAGAPDATPTTKGLVQLAGDLGGTGTAAAAPVITDGAITNSKIANGAVSTNKLAAGSVTSNEIADGTITNTDISGTAAIARTKLDSSTQTSLGKADTAEQTANKGVASGYAPLNGSSQVPIANLPTGSSSSTIAIGNDARFAGSAAGTAGSALAATDPTTTNSRAPSGSASGDLSGTYPGPTVAKINGVTVSGTPSNGQVITATGSSAASWGPPAAAPVSSVFARTGAVTAQNGDYSFSQVGAAQGLAATGVKTSAYGAAAGDFVPVDASSTSVTVTLPTAPADKTRVGIKLIAISGSFTAAITAAGGDVFNKAGGSTTLTLSLLNQGLLLQYASSSGIWYVQADDLPLSQLAQLASPAFTGTPTAPTQLAGDNTTKIATTAYVDTGLSGKQSSLGYTPENVANKSTDGTLSGNSDINYPSQKATKTYADTKMATSTYDPAAIAQQVVGTTASQALTNKDLTSGTNTFPTLNQNTSGSAAKWTTARNLAGNSVDGSANVAFANKFIVQGTSDSGLSAAQFLGALSTGIMMVTTTTGVVTSITAPTGAIVGTTDTQTLTNKTLTSPSITTPTGVVKGDVGLGNVDNTSDATKNSATSTLTNKRITRRVVAVTQSATPAINTDNTDVASITGLAQAITSMTTNLTGTPVDGDMLIVRITDNGTARAITWGSSFEASTVSLPTTTVISAMLMVGFAWNTATSKWRCIAAA